MERSNAVATQIRMFTAVLSPILPFQHRLRVAETSMRQASCPEGAEKFARLAVLEAGTAPAVMTFMSTDHRKLSAFTLADEFAVRVYTATREFPVEERYGLRSQIRRAAVSTPTNVVEGCARESHRERDRFLEIAFGSARETIYLIDLARRVDVMNPDSARDLVSFGGRVAAALAALRKARAAKPLNPSSP